MMYAPLYFGVDQNIFADEGYELKFMTMRTDLAIAALGTGDVDYSTHGGASAARRSAGLPSQVGLRARSQDVVLAGGSPQIKTARQARRELGRPGEAK